MQHDAACISCYCNDLCHRMQLRMYMHAYACMQNLAPHYAEAARDLKHIDPEIILAKVGMCMVTWQWPVCALGCACVCTRT